MEEQDVMYWSDFVDFTHAKQVEMFGWCACEDNEGRENPYEDCLTEGWRL